MEKREGCTRGIYPDPGRNVETVSGDFVRGGFRDHNITDENTDYMEDLAAKAYFREYQRISSPLSLRRILASTTPIFFSRQYRTIASRLLRTYRSLKPPILKSRFVSAMERGNARAIRRSLSRPQFFLPSKI